MYVGLPDYVPIFLNSLSKFISRNTVLLCGVNITSVH